MAQEAPIFPTQALTWVKREHPRRFRDTSRGLRCICLLGQPTTFAFDNST